MAILPPYHTSIAVVLGFEETEFTVFEEDLFVELCVTVFEPLVIDPNTGLPLNVDINDINIITQSQDGTAGITARFMIYFIF